MKTYMTLAIVAAVAVMLVASVAVATGDAFAGKKKYEKNQALSQANACGNGELPLNVFCSNSASQVQGKAMKTA
jgi:Na+-translocating ferredoxin:NAD+ oxidoreductase RnfG subunit